MGNRKLTTKDYADLANTKHAEIISAMRTVLHLAKEAGDALRKARQCLRESGKGHGHWQPWVRENFHGSYETACVYVRISTHWKQLYEEVATNPGLTIEQALAILRHKRPQRKFDEWWKNDDEEQQKRRYKFASTEIVGSLKGLLERVLLEGGERDQQLIIAMGEHELGSGVFEACFTEMVRELAPIIERLTEPNAKEQLADYASEHRHSLTKMQRTALEAMGVVENEEEHETPEEELETAIY
jgi:hypothetical protein